MVSRLLARLFLVMTAREFLILLALGIATAGIPMVMEQVHFLRTTWGETTPPAALEEMERLIDGFAGILVAAGVFIESRVTLRGMALRGGRHVHSFAETGIQGRLDDVAHQNGMGLLLVGLFQEIGTLLTGMPQRIVHSREFEKPIFAFCLLLSVAAYLILLDFVRDYVVTYFKGADVGADTKPTE